MSTITTIFMLPPSWVPAFNGHRLCSVHAHRTVQPMRSKQSCNNSVLSLFTACRYLSGPERIMTRGRPRHDA